MQRLADIARRAAVAVVRRGAAVHSMQQRMPAAAVQVPAVAARPSTQPAIASMQAEAADISAHLPLVRLASIEAEGSTVIVLPSTHPGLASRRGRQERC
jgi:hypothetical protein